MKFWIIYPVVGYLFYLFCMSREGKDTDDSDRKIFILVALLWPLMLLPTLLYLGGFSNFRDGPLTRSYDGGQEPGLRRTPSSGKEYNDMAFGDGKPVDEDDMAAFISHISRRPDAPLPEALTLSYKPTGISKTYPTGTPFPSALVNDWRRGFYMGKQAQDGDEG